MKEMPEALVSRTLWELKQPIFRHRAIARFEEYQYKPAIPILMDLLSEKAFGGRIAYALVKIGGVETLSHSMDILAKFPVFSEDRRKWISSFAFACKHSESKAVVIPSLVSFLTHQDHIYRANAVRILGEIGDHTYMDNLVERFDDPDNIVRREAIFSWASINTHLRQRNQDTKLLEKLANIATNDSDSEVRGMVGFALASMSLPSVVPTLIQMLDDFDVSVRVSSVFALGDLAQVWIEEVSVALPKLNAMWNDESEHSFVKQELYHCLAHIKSALMYHQKKDSNS